MLTNEQLQANHDEFVQLLRTINRQGANIEKLIDKLEHSDFFIAPASTKYHGAFYGGLCEHSLNVYYNLKHLVKYKGPKIDTNEIPEDSITITALLHDLSKMNIYERTYRNKKDYNPQGNQSDGNGRFDWVSEEAWKKKEAVNTFLYGNHEMNAEYMIRQFIPLTLEESVAILHHMGSMGYDSAKDDITAIYGKYALSPLLHAADLLATYIDEA